MLKRNNKMYIGNDDNDNGGDRVENLIFFIKIFFSRKDNSNHECVILIWSLLLLFSFTSIFLFFFFCFNSKILGYVDKVLNKWN